MNTGRTWENTWIGQCSDIKEIKFAPKFFGLALAAATASGDIKVYAPSQGNPKDWQENFGVIQTRANGVAGCGCVEWGTAFDEPIMMAVGCEQENPASKEKSSLI